MTNDVWVEALDTEARGHDALAAERYAQEVEWDRQRAYEESREAFEYAVDSAPEPPPDFYDSGRWGES